MKITKRQLRKIIQEALPYKGGQPWIDTQAPVGVDRTEDDLDRELTDEEIEVAMGMERADPSGDREFFLGYEDALDGKGLPVGASPDYKAGWEDGNLDRVTESIIKEASFGGTAQMAEDGSYFRDVIVMSPNGDSVLVDGNEVYIQDVPRQLELMGFPMTGNDPDNLIFALEEMMADGYVELMVTYENGIWSW